MLTYKVMMLAAALAIPGCTTSTTVGTPGTVPAGLQTTEYGCASAGAALAIINANFARLTVAQRATVAQAKSVTDPICLQVVPPTLASTAKAGFDAAVLQLSAAAK
jgi:hypothetical protein